MTTTWTQLKADAAFIREGNEDAFQDSKYDNTYLQDSLFLTSAKRVMKNDLMNVFKLFENLTGDMTILDGVVNNNVEQLKVALAYQQLYKFYFSIAGETGGKNYNRMVEYDKLYNEQKKAFRSLYSGATTSVRSITVSR